MRRALRLLFVGSFALTAACGTILAIDDGEEAPSPLPNGADGAVAEQDALPIVGDANGADALDADASFSSEDGSVDPTRDADADAGNPAQGDADAATPPIPDASPGPCGSCRSGFCARGPGLCDPLVFITKVPHDGDFTLSATGGGTAETDSHCRQAATGIPGHFRSWTGSGNDDHPTMRIKPFANAPYRRPDGVIVVDTFDDFQAGQLTLKAAINVTLDGTVLPNTTEVWTGLTHLGSVSQFQCTEWTAGFLSGGSKGSFGIVQACARSNDVACNGKWTAADAGSCAGLRHLYCIQSDEP